MVSTRTIKWGIQFILILSLKGQNLATDLANSTEKSNSLHFYCSAIGTGLTARTLDFVEEHLNIEPHQTRNILIAGTFMFGVGLGKEYMWDGYFKKGVKSKADIFMNGIGVVSGMMVKRCLNDWRERKKQQLEYKKRILE